MKDNNQVESNSRIFEYLGVISFGLCGFHFRHVQSFYELLFTGEYVAGYIVAPYLFLAPLLQMLFQVACNQFLVVKKTWPNFFILSLGAVVNVFLNLALIPRFGIEGAAIATLIGYVVSDILAVIVLTRMKLMKLRLKFFGVAIVMVLFMGLWRLLAVDTPLLGLAMAICGIFDDNIALYRDVMMLFKNKK